jgi:hypothetical protein
MPLYFPRDVYLQSGYDLHTYKFGVAPFFAPAKAYDFLNMNGSLSSDLAFSRASSAMQYNSAGLLVQAPMLGPRFDYNPTTLALNGLLIEGAATNLNITSSNFSTNWSPIGPVSPTTNNIAPDGTATAYSWSNAGGAVGYYLSITVSPSTTYTISQYCKAISGNSVVQVGSDSTVWGGGTNTYGAYVFFNPATQAFSNIQSGVTSYGYQTLPNGWFRVWVTATTNSTATGLAQTLYNTGSASVVAMWGAQFEAGAFASSYIPTTTSTVTRALDSLTNSSVSSWFSGSGVGTYVGEFILEGIPIANTAIVSAPSKPTLALGSNYVKGSFPGVVDVVSQTVTMTTNVVHKAAFSFATGAYAVTMDGATPATSANAQAVSAPTSLVFGAQSIQLNGWLRRFSYYNNTLTSAQIQQLTK